MTDEYKPCTRCAAENTETLDQGGVMLCEPCHNFVSCGCEVCAKAAPEVSAELVIK